MCQVNFRDPAVLADPASRWNRPGALFRSAPRGGLVTRLRTEVTTQGDDGAVRCRPVLPFLSRRPDANAARIRERWAAGNPVES